MKKVFLLCLFILLSLGVFAQKIKSDGKPHFDKILWTLWSEKASDRDEPSGMGLLEIVKKKLEVGATAIIRPGFEFNVMLNSDLALEPYYGE